MSEFVLKDAEARGLHWLKGVADDVSEFIPMEFKYGDADRPEELFFTLNSDMSWTVNWEVARRIIDADHTAYDALKYARALIAAKEAGTLWERPMS